MPNNITEKVLDGSQITKEEALELINADLHALAIGANLVKEKFCSKKFEFCSIINAKSGQCSENCKFCAQSGHYNTNIKKYPLEQFEEVLKTALINEKNGIKRIALVTSGRNLSQKDLKSLCNIYSKLNKATTMKICASHGLLSYNDFVLLKNAGVTRCHNNLETSRRYFSEICTTHTYDDKITAINNAKHAGLSICSGGIIGMGETWEDRIDLAMQLRELEVKSVPINFLSPIQGTPLEHIKPLSQEDYLRTAIIFRYILPNSVIRLAGGRRNLTDYGHNIFSSAANAAISGHMLTTCGTGISDDTAMITSIGYTPGLLP